MAEGKSVALLIDRDQIDKIVLDLIACKDLGAGTVFFIMTPYDEDHEDLESGRLPRRKPDVIAYDTVFTVGMGDTIEEVLDKLDAADHD